MGVGKEHISSLMKLYEIFQRKVVFIRKELIIMMNNFKTRSELEHERKVIKSCIEDAKEEIKEARLFKDDTWAKELYSHIHRWRKEIEQIDAALED